MAAPSYALTNYFYTTDTAGDILTLIENQLTSAGWTFIEQVSFTQAATARVMRVWQNPASMNAAGTDFYIGLVKNAAAGYYLALRTFEGWNTTTKLIQRPVLQAGATLTPNITSITYGGGQFVGVGSGTDLAYTSPDGITWTPRRLPSVASWVTVAYGNGLYVTMVGGSSNTSYATSPDGITWTARSLPTAAQNISVAYGAGLFVLVSTSTTNIYYTSPDGITWTSRSSMSSIANYNINFINGVFLVVSVNSATAQSSTDGLTWTARTLANGSTTYYGSAYGNSTYVVINVGATSQTSPTLVTWTSRTMPANVTWTGVAYGNSTFVAVSSTSGIVATSPDGITWTQRTGPTGSQSSIATNGSIFVSPTNSTPAVGSIYTSSDGTAWTARQCGQTTQTGAPDYVLAGTSLPAFLDLQVTFTASTSYDVGVLASKSYLVININANGTTATTISWVAGLYQPAYTDSQATSPPLCLMTLPGLGGGVSRYLRSFYESGSFTFNAQPGPESVLYGTFNGAVREPNSNAIRASRVILVAGSNPSAGYTTPGSVRGWLYDCYAVATNSVSTIKVADTITVGGVTYTGLGQSTTNITMNSAGTPAMGYFFNTTAGS